MSTKPEWIAQHRRSAAWTGVVAALLAPIWALLVIGTSGSDVGMIDPESVLAGALLSCVGGYGVYRLLCRIA